MKLSEAIRLGAMIRPQGFGQLFHGDASCAMGAALEAIGYSKHSHLPWIANPFREFSQRHLTACPACDQTNPCTIVSHLNDDHKWTREQIADWVETIESIESPALSPVAQGQEVGA